MAALSRRWLSIAVVLLLAVLAAELVLSVRQETQTWDEGAHLYAGYTYWKRADYGQNPEHPPLVKLFAALPLLPMQLKDPPDLKGNSKIETFVEGRDFLYGNDADRVIFRARMAAAILCILLAFFVFLAGRELFGAAAGLIALLLIVFEPNIIAHGALVTTDIGISLGLLVAVYSFYRYVKSPTWPRLLIAGLATGVALSVKHSGLLIFPILAALAGCEILLGSERRKLVLRYIGSLAVIAVLAVAVLWTSYGFHFRARPAGLDVNPSFSESVQRLSPVESRVLSMAARLRLLPEPYLYGIADVRWTSNFSATYLWGKMYPHGVWFYFPATFVVKATLAFMSLCLLAIACIALRRLTRRREILYVAVPGALYMAAAMSSGLNLGVRHILPVFVFLAILVGGACAALMESSRRWTYVVAALVLLHAISSLRVYPHYIAYANEAFGGPADTYKYLSGSNTDWGQQLKSVKQYLNDRGIRDCWFAYFAQTAAEPRYYDIPCKPLPVISSIWLGEHIEAPPQIDGTVLVSAGTLTGFQFGPGVLHPYAPFVNVTPTDYIDYGVFVYQGRFEIPLLSAISHTNSAYRALGANQPDAALSHAQTAVDLAPNDVGSRLCLGIVLSAVNRGDEARPHFERALELATTVHPEFQAGFVPTLKERLKPKHKEIAR